MACNMDFAIDHDNSLVSEPDLLGGAVPALELPGVALGHQPSSMDDHRGVGGGQRAGVVEELVEQGGQGHAGRDVAEGPFLGRPRRPAGWTGRAT